MNESSRLQGTGMIRLCCWQDRELGQHHSGCTKRAPLPHPPHPCVNDNVSSVPSAKTQDQEPGRPGTDVSSWEGCVESGV